MESGLSGIFQLKPIAKNGAWVHGDPFYVYVGQSETHIYEAI